MKFLNDPLLLAEKTTAIDRFLKYVAVETTSNAQNPESPSSVGQKELGKMLVNELNDLGLSGASVDANGYVTATLPGTGPHTVGLVAHLDTADAYTAHNVTPIVHQNYDGRQLTLKNDIILSPDSDPWLKKCLGHTIITSDGTTLLGADDKAGIAIIMGILEYIQNNPETPHPTVRICFTPDEEIGRGANHFPITQLGADFALTVDGTFLGELNFETFEAYSIDVVFEGVSVHPGYAKDVMVNALRHLGDFLSGLPKSLSPETTSDRQGFIHPISVFGDAAKCQAHLIVRDFTEAGAKKLCLCVEKQVAEIQIAEPRLKTSIHKEFNYPNMMKFMESHDSLATNLKRAVQEAGILPSVVPIRGGTDGANLSRKGLITPNVFTGAVNLHGPKEWVSVTNMGYSFCTLLNLLKMYATSDGAAMSTGE